MKKFILISLMIIASTLVNGQAFIDDVFNKYSGKTGFTSVMITPQLFKLISLLDKEDKDLKTISEKISSLRILVSENKTIGFTNEIREKMSKGSYLNIMEVIDGKQKVNFYVKQNNDVITDLILLAIDEKEEVLLSITGNLKLNELSNLGKNSSFGQNTGHMSLLKNLEEK